MFTTVLTVEATYKIAVAILSQLTTNKIPARFGLSRKGRDDLAARAKRLVQRYTDTQCRPSSQSLHQQIAARGQVLEQRRAQRVDRDDDRHAARWRVGRRSVVCPVGPRRRAVRSHGGPFQSALAVLLSGLGYTIRTLGDGTLCALIQAGLRVGESFVWDRASPSAPGPTGMPWLKRRGPQVCPGMS